MLSETWLTWSFDASGDVAPEQIALIDLSRQRGCTVVVGAWVATDSAAMRNVVLIVRDGAVLAMVDKMHPVPFVEGRPRGTSRLVEMGLIPACAVRKVARGGGNEFDPWQGDRLVYVPSVCYDGFFSDTYRRYSHEVPSIALCCLDEGFESTGVFQSLSRVHSRLRAVEMREPLVRDSLGGVSGAFDILGNEIERIAKSNGTSVLLVAPCRFSYIVRALR